LSRLAWCVVTLCNAAAAAGIVLLFWVLPESGASSKDGWFDGHPHLFLLSFCGVINVLVGIVSLMRLVRSGPKSIVLWCQIVNIAIVSVYLGGALLVSCPGYRVSTH